MQYQFYCMASKDLFMPKFLILLQIIVCLVKRFLLPYSRFMVHQPLSAFGYSKFTDSKIALKEMESVRNDLYEVLSRNCQKPIEEIIEMCEHGDRWMKPEETIGLGFADKIIKKSI